MRLLSTAIAVALAFVLGGLASDARAEEARPYVGAVVGFSKQDAGGSTETSTLSGVGGYAGLRQRDFAFELFYRRGTGSAGEGKNETDISARIIGISGIGFYSASPQVDVFVGGGVGQTSCSTEGGSVVCKDDRDIGLHVRTGVELSKGGAFSVRLGLEAGFDTKFDDFAPAASAGIHYYFN